MFGWAFSVAQVPGLANSVRKVCVSATGLGFKAVDASKSSREHNWNRPGFRA